MTALFCFKAAMFLVRACYNFVNRMTGFSPVINSSPIFLLFFFVFLLLFRVIEVKTCAFDGIYDLVVKPIIKKNEVQPKYSNQAKNLRFQSQ